MSPRWGMVIDLRRCVGCQTCTIACKQEHGLAAGTQWRFVADCEAGEYPDVRRVFLPMQCMHCAEPPCVPVCPTGASRRRGDGIVWVEYDACVGCGYCAVACPYHARHLVHGADGYFAAPTPAERATARPARHDVMTKCTFCKERVDAGRAAGLVPGVDADATPMCAVACIAGAIVFGDLDDPASRVRALLGTTSAAPLTPECGTEPSVYYVTGDGPPPDLEPRPAAPAAVSCPAPRADRRPPELIAATPQTSWGMPAVLNFTLGGLGAGFYMAAAVAAGLGLTGAMGLAAWLAPALVLTGFAAVAIEAGRPLRGARVLRSVATSWMSRELWLGGLFVLLALADDAAPQAGLRLPAAAAAAALVLAQGLMLTRARAIAAWSVPMMPVVFAAAAAVSGVGLLVLTELLAGRLPGRALLATTLVVLALGLLVWLAFLASSADPAFVRATAPLRRGRTAAEILVAGYVLPLALLALALALPAWAPGPAALAAGLALLGQLRARAALILTAGLRRPVTLATLTLRRTSP